MKNVLRSALCAFVLLSSQFTYSVVPEEAEPQLVFSLSDDRSVTELLQGAQLQGNSYVYVSNDQDIKSVFFYIDDYLLHREFTAPFDLAGTLANLAPRPYDFSKLTVGAHTLSVDIEFKADALGVVPDGKKLNSTFYVISDEERPALPFRLVYSESSSRSNPLPLYRAELEGDQYVYVEDSFEILSVEFFVNQNTYSLDAIKPFDLAGGTSRVANPYDFSQLRPGSNEIMAKIILRNDTIVTLDARFKVPSPDAIAPTISLAWSEQPNESGWFGQPVTITPSCMDEEGGSGIAQCSEAQTISTDGEEQVYTFTATDNAGNSTEASATVSLDMTPPEVELAVSSPSNINGWWKAPVSVSAICNDLLSGIVDCPQQDALTESGVHLVAITATDAAGNSTEVQIDIQLDMELPTIQPQFSTQPSASGWHTAPVTVSWSCSDQISGAANCPQAVLLSEAGQNQSLSATVTDLAGNSASSAVTLNLDFVSPELTFLSHVNDGLVLDPRPVIRIAATDDIGISPSSVGLVWQGEQANCAKVGAEYHCQFTSDFPGTSSQQITAFVKDLAGHEASASIQLSLDADADQVADYVDQCLDSSLSEPVDEVGCDAYQRDSDGDGFSDAEEETAGSDPFSPSETPTVAILSFSASTIEVASANTDVQLFWQIQGPAEVSLKNDAEATVVSGLSREGTATVSPSITTRYTLVATGPQGTLTQTIKVSINTPPPDELWQNPPSLPVDAKAVAAALTVQDDSTSLLSDTRGGLSKVSESGELLWSLNLGGLTQSAPLIINDVAHIGVASGEGLTRHGTGYVKAVAQDGALLWSFETQGAVIASPIASHDAESLFVVTYAGFLYALSTGGEPLWELKVSDGALVSKPALMEETSLLVKTELGEFLKINIANGVQGDRVVWRRNLQ